MYQFEIEESQRAFRFWKKLFPSKVNFLKELSSEFRAPRLLYINKSTKVYSVYDKYISKVKYVASFLILKETELTFKIWL